MANMNLKDALNKALKTTKQYIDKAIEENGFSGDYNDLENRPCYDESIIVQKIIHFDGVYDTELEYNEIFKCCRPTDDILTIEDIEAINSNGIIKYHYSYNDTISEFPVSGGLFYSGIPNIYIHESSQMLIVLNDVTAEDLESLKITGPSQIMITKGVWFMPRTESPVAVTLTFNQNVGVIKKLDEKFIPDSVIIKKINVTPNSIITLESGLYYLTGSISYYLNPEIEMGYSDRTKEIYLDDSLVQVRKNENEVKVKVLSNFSYSEVKNHMSDIDITYTIENNLIVKINTIFGVSNNKVLSKSYNSEGLFVPLKCNDPVNKWYADQNSFTVLDDYNLWCVDTKAYKLQNVYSEKDTKEYNESLYGQYALVSGFIDGENYLDEDLFPRQEATMRDDGSVDYSSGNSNDGVTDYIYINSDTNFMSNVLIEKIAFYDSKKNYIENSLISNVEPLTTIIVPQDANYMRIYFNVWSALSHDSSTFDYRQLREIGQKEIHVNIPSLNKTFHYYFDNNVTTDYNNMVIEENKFSGDYNDLENKPCYVINETVCFEISKEQLNAIDTTGSDELMLDFPIVSYSDEEKDNYRIIINNKEYFIEHVRIESSGRWVFEFYNAVDEESNIDGGCSSTNYDREWNNSDTLAMIQLLKIDETQPFVFTSSIKLIHRETQFLDLNLLPKDIAIRNGIFHVGSTVANKYSAAFGSFTEANAAASMAQGNRTQANKNYSHAEGSFSIANGVSSHAEGENTIASGQSQHVQGKYNIEDTANKYAHIVGNGSRLERKNAHTLDWDGNAWYQGQVQGINLPHDTRVFEEIEITFNGDIEGKETVLVEYPLAPVSLSNVNSKTSDTSNIRYVKASDKAISYEEFCSVISLTAANISVEGELTEFEFPTEELKDALIKINDNVFVVGYTSENYPDIIITHENITVDSVIGNIQNDLILTPGIWFLCIDENAYISKFKYQGIISGELKKLDEKYLPDSIANGINVITEEDLQSIFDSIDDDMMDS